MKFYVRILVLLALSVLLPCIAVLATTNYITLTQYQETISDAQIDRLRVAANTNALIIENIEQGALRFSLDPAIQSLSNLTVLDFGPGNNAYLGDLLRIQRMLVEFVSTNELLDSVYLHIDGSDYIISSRDSVMNIGRFTDLGWMDRYRVLREDRGASRMMSAHSISVRYGASLESDDYSHDCLTYVYPITPFTSTFHGALVFNIREDKLLELYMGNSPDGNIAIFDSEGNWLTGVETLDYSSILDEPEWLGVFTAESPGTGHFFPRMDSGHMQCTYFRSSNHRYVLLAVQDLNALMEKMRSFQIVFVVFILLFIPFVALLVVLVSRRLYSPIGKLVKELDSGGMIGISGEKDALSAISRAIKELLREDHRLFSTRASKSCGMRRFCASSRATGAERRTRISGKSCPVPAISVRFAPRTRPSPSGARTKITIPASGCWCG